MALYTSDDERVLYIEESEWKQKLADEMKRTKTLEKSIQRLRTEIEAGNQTRIKQHSVKSMVAHILLETIQTQGIPFRISCQR